MSIKEHRQSAFDEANVAEKVKLHIPEGYKVRVFKVLSRDSGNQYWVQVLQTSLLHSPNTQIILCDCYAGKFIQPLEVLGLADDLRCKHVKDLLEVLK